jgi:Zn-dependent M32 family carboxypeptidase
MPEGSASSRGAQKSALAGVLYDKRTEKELGQLLEQLKGAAGLDPVQAAVVREAQRLGTACAKRGARREGGGGQPQHVLFAVNAPLTKVGQ